MALKQSKVCIELQSFVVVVFYILTCKLLSKQIQTLDSR